MSNHPLFVLLLILMLSQQANCQQPDDWPSSLNYFKKGNNRIMDRGCRDTYKKHREVVSEERGKEYYCSGNVHAEGPIILLNSYHSPMQEYGRTGRWKVYFDSSIQILRSEGDYKNGKINGHWKIYSTTHNPKFEFEFDDEIIKRKIEIDSLGNRHSIISLSDMNIFLMKYETLLGILAVIPIVLLRIGFNILTYNKINKTNYIPMFQNWQKGGASVNLKSTVIFWWILRSHDSETVRKYKTIANIISLFSIACFVSIMTLYLVFSK